MNEDKSIRFFFSILLLCLIGFVVFVIINEKTVPGTYKYKDFDIHQVIDPNTGSVTYKIKMYITNPMMTEKAVYVNTRYEPIQVENIILEGDVKKSIVGKDEIYLTIDPNENLSGKTTIAMLEIDKFIDNKYFFNKPVKSAFIKEHNNWTVKNCKDVDEKTSVIWLKLGENNRIYEEDGCVILQGITEEDLIMLADGLIFKILGVT
jgi:hypothetical protein